MTSHRKPRATETRLDELASMAEDLDGKEVIVGTCPKCQGEMKGSRVEREPGGHVSTLRCTVCGYVYMQRS